MISLKRILHPTDFSDCSRKALGYACALAEKFHAELHLIHVLQDPLAAVPEPGMLYPLTDETLREIHRQAEASLAAMPDPQWSAGRTLARVVRRGSPFAETVRYASEAKIDLIVLGTHGRSGLPRLLLGSVAEKIVRKAPCPVLAVHPDEREFVADE